MHKNKRFNAGKLCKNRNFILIVIVLIIYQLVYGETPPQKRITAFSITDEISIDGNLDENSWSMADFSNQFFQYDPANGKQPRFDTQVRVLYDNNALYIGAQMFDPAPDSIRTGLGERDDWSMDADIFAVTLDPFNNGLSGFEFWVSASGVQVDKYFSVGGGEGFNWDAVWESNVKINENGWIAELRIPYSAIRFPKKEVQEWAAIFWRSISRHNEWLTWQHINPEINGFMDQAGKIDGFQNIQPPTRLAFYPYVSAYIENNTNNNLGYSYGGGMDVKYGLNQSFTLDVTLIPDFSQVQSDDQVLNLSPYEIQFEEKRQFFTEGMDIFNKGGIFYSRRLGSQPAGYDDAEENLGNNEFIQTNPSKNRMINATKLSGRTQKDLGIGFFNAMTSTSKAIIEDSASGYKREFITQPFTNYSVFVLDQNLKNNSYISFINTNVYKSDDHYSANVSGLDFRLVEKGNNFAISGKLNVSQHYNISLNPVFGQEYFLNFRKVSGKFRFGVSRLSRSDTYDPNDLGYLQRNNETCNKLNLGYYEFKPLWKFLNWFASFEINQSNLYAPNKFAELSFRLITEATLKNNSRIGLQSVLFPIERHDYYESREAGRVFIRPATYEVSASFIPDYKKKIGIGLIAAIENSFASVFDQHSYYIKINPSYRPNNKFRIGYDIQSQINKQETGYVDNLEEDILFGKRNVNTLINTITSSYIFNRKASLSLKIRHYWSTVVYDEYFVLRGDGYLDKTDYSGNYNINYNAFNVDLFYTWNFAPGSELSVMWKNIILHNEDAVSMNYFENLDHILSFPQTNSISVKLLYYIDYQQIKKKFQG